MKTIFAKNVWTENRAITKKDLINPKFECDIFINEIKLNDNMTINGENNITYVFKNDYNDLGCMFNRCYSLTSINLSNLNTNNVTNMGCMFNGCSSLTSINLSNFNTNNVIYMGNMFNGCKSLTSLDITNFDCEKIKTTDDMENMFSGCKSLTIKNIKYRDFKIRTQAMIDLMGI